MTHGPGPGDQASLRHNDIAPIYAPAEDLANTESKQIVLKARKPRLKLVLSRDEPSGDSDDLSLTKTTAAVLNWGSSTSFLIIPALVVLSVMMLAGVRNLGDRTSDRATFIRRRRSGWIKKWIE
jgi:hypothetical protein